ncbi:hypothetical protein [Nitrosomonas halophila]|uniref:Uncharacterized protein n=1 Tax=Nitrosomonas halophila TaxID=44576 RepID=A0A1H3J0A4_9PROT|nr:hypothetical protein [Nitrosomonas halophila]SDY32989.1 hypothetical protein SAMN05421881_102925 [Nitrosomonas halophila]
MIPKLKENMSQVNPTGNSGIDPVHDSKPAGAAQQIDTRDRTVLARQMSLPDAEWRRSKSARFQLN